MKFPDGIRPISQSEWQWVSSTILSRNPESGRTVTRAARTNQLLSCGLTFPVRPIADYSALRAFCRFANGQNLRFTFLDYNGVSASLGAAPLAPWPVDASLGYAGAGAIPCTMVSDGSFAVGDGVTLTFDLPFSSLPGSTPGVHATVYDNGASTSNYTLSLTTGTDGRDQVVFGGGHAPAAGHVLTASSPSARLSVYARLATDSFTGKTTVGGGGPIQPTLSIIQDP